MTWSTRQYHSVVSLISAKPARMLTVSATVAALRGCSASARATVTVATSAMGGADAKYNTPDETVTG